MPQSSRDVKSKKPVRFLPLLVSLLIFLALVPQVLHFARHGAPDREIWNLPAWQTLETLELSLLDRRFVTRGNLTPPSRDRIAIVGIDEATLFNKKAWPFPRRWHAKLIERLHRAGARVIGLDIGFDGYQGKTNETLSRDDQDLARAIERAKNVVLVSRFEQSRLDAGVVQATFDRFMPPVDEFDVLTPDLGVTWVPRDLDAEVRRYPFSLVKPPEKEPFGGFAPLCVGMYQGLVGQEDLGRYRAALHGGFWRDAQGTTHDLPLSEGTMNDARRSGDKTRVWTLPLWFWGAPGTFPIHSYDEVLNRWSDARCEREFKGRIVFVGATASILKDTFPIPHFSSRDTFAVQREISGVEVHATMAAMLLDGQFLYEQRTEIALFITWFCTLGASAWTHFLNPSVARSARRASAWWVRRGFVSRIHDGVWLGLYALLGMLPIALFWGLCQWMFSTYHLWIWAIFPMLGAVGASVGTMLLLFGEESAERRKTQTQMSRIVDPDVMEEILAHPEAGYPRSRRVEATIVFVDLENFTGFADTNEPEEIVEALNAFFTRMHPIISAHSGCIDKYIGDSIMAFFGAPLPRADHAAQALRCAIALQDECARFRGETNIPFLMRIGVHTGTVLVGSVGSQQQFNYTVMGDTVNLAARLEKKNKEFGSRILCSSQTHDAAPGIARVERARTPIRGKVDEIEVFIVRGPLDEAPHDTMWNGTGDAAQFDAEGALTPS